MEKETQKISVRIGGMSYNLVSSESESYVRQIAARADEMIRRVAISSPKLSQQMTVILALTNAVDELTRQAQHQSLAEQQRDTSELKVTELRTELAKSRELNWEMKKELLRLNTLCHQQEERIKTLEKQALEIATLTIVADDASEEPEESIELELPAASEQSNVFEHTDVSDLPAASESKDTPEPAAEVDDDEYSEDDENTETVEYPVLKKTPVFQPGTMPVLTSKRPLKTIGELRQTGLEEYFSLFDQPKSHELENRKEDES